MPILGNLIAWIGGALAGLFFKLFAARLAIRAAGVAALATIVAALMATFNLVVAPLAETIFSTPYAGVIGLAFPPVAGPCMAAMTTVWAACALYGVNRRAIQMSAGA